MLDVDTENPNQLPGADDQQLSRPSRRTVPTQPSATALALGRRSYPPELRRKVVDQVEAGRSVTDVARDLGISDQSVYAGRRQDRIDRGLVPGLTSGEKAELATSKRRIAGLETELRAMRRAMELVREVMPPKRRFQAVKVMAAEAIPVQVACRVLEVSVTGSTTGCPARRRHV